MKIVNLVLLALVPILGICRGEEDGLVRLNNRGSTGSNSGIVEVFHGGVWRTICAGPYWNSAAETVICIQLGFNGGVSTANPNDYYSDGLFETVWDGAMYCEGTESVIADCIEHVPEPAYNCPNDQGFAAVICAEGKRTEDFKELRALQLLLDLLQRTKK